MAVESAADRLAFLADFGVPVGWTSGAVTTALTGILNAGAVRQEGQGDMMSAFVNERATLLVSVATLPIGADVDDAVSAAGRAYTAKSIEPDGTGMALVRLELVTES